MGTAKPMVSVLHLFVINGAAEPSGQKKGLGVYIFCFNIWRKKVF